MIKHIHAKHYQPIKCYFIHFLTVCYAKSKIILTFVVYYVFGILLETIESKLFVLQQPRAYNLVICSRLCHKDNGSAPVIRL